MGSAWVLVQLNAGGPKECSAERVFGRLLRTMPDGATDCAFACNTMLDNCTGILIRAGYPHIAFDGYTPADCISFILATPYC